MVPVEAALAAAPPRPPKLNPPPIELLTGACDKAAVPNPNPVLGAVEVMDPTPKPGQAVVPPPMAPAADDAAAPNENPPPVAAIGAPRDNPGAGAPLAEGGLKLPKENPVDDVVVATAAATKRGA